MRKSTIRNIAVTAFVFCLVSQFAWPLTGAFAQDASPQASVAQPVGSPPGPQVKPAGPGVFVSKPIGAGRFRLTVNGHAFTTRDAIEKYLAYRAARLTLDQKAQWFAFAETRGKGDTVAKPKRDPAGMRYSFRMAYFRPVWRYKIAGTKDWKSWSPFTGKAFWGDGVDPKIITDYQVNADIALEKGAFEDDNPLAFDADAVSDFLASQVDPPQ
jgi:hypothetical protein